LKGSHVSVAIHPTISTAAVFTIFNATHSFVIVVVSSLLLSLPYPMVIPALQ
jgi:hypothetical protein